MLPHAIDLARGGTGKKAHEKMQGGPRPSSTAPVAVEEKERTESSHGHGHGHGHGGHTCFHHSDRETKTDAASLGLGTPGMRHYVGGLTNTRFIVTVVCLLPRLTETLLFCVPP